MTSTLPAPLSHRPGRGPANAAADHGLWLRWGLRLALVALAIVAILALLPKHASATHFRGGTFYAEPLGNSSEVRFQGVIYFRTSYGWSPTPTVGQVYTYAGGGPNSASGFANLVPDATAPGATIPYDMEVTAAVPGDDWFGAKIIDPVDGKDGVYYQYPGDGTEPYLAKWGTSFCCRLSLNSGNNHHINNPDAGAHLETLVDFQESPYNSPVISAFPPIVRCPLNDVCWIEIPNIDADQDTVTMRWATTAESELTTVNPGLCGSCGGHAAILHSDNQTIEWDTHDATYYEDCPAVHSLYSVQVMLEDLDGATPPGHQGVEDEEGNVSDPVHHKTPVDFLIDLCPTPPNKLSWTARSACGVRRLVLAGTPIHELVEAANTEATASITLYNLMTPPGGTTTWNTNPGNPANGYFDWTPTTAGSYLAVYSGFDSLGNTLKPCTIRITVVEPPEVDFTWHFTTTAPLDYTLDPVQFTPKVVERPWMRGFGRAHGWTFSSPNPGSYVLGTSLLKEPLFNYPHAAAYPVCLTVSFVQGTDSVQGTKCHDVDVHNRPPVAAFTQLVDIETREVRFYDQSTDRDGTVVDWAWDFGGVATPAAFAGVSPPVVKFPHKGIYQVHLGVKDDLGAPAATDQPVLVPNAPPIVSRIQQYEIPAGTYLTLEAFARDSDLDALTMSLRNNPREMAITDHGDGTATLGWQTSLADLGDYHDVTVVATDTEGATGVWAYDIKVFDPARDTDRDGVADMADNCPTVANREQADTNGDGVGDLCADLSAPAPVYGDGIPDSQANANGPGGPDQDNDGVADTADLCPTVSDRAQRDLDADGIGDACDVDRDGDGLVQASGDKRVPLDNCPDVPNTDQRDSDQDGLGDACDLLAPANGQGSGSLGNNGNGGSGAGGSSLAGGQGSASRGVLGQAGWGGLVAALAIAAVVGAFVVILVVRKSAK